MHPAQQQKDTDKDPGESEELLADFGGGKEEALAEKGKGQDQCEIEDDRAHGVIGSGFYFRVDAGLEPQCAAHRALIAGVVIGSEFFTCFD